MGSGEGWLEFWCSALCCSAVSTLISVCCLMHLWYNPSATPILLKVTYPRRVFCYVWNGTFLAVPLLFFSPSTALTRAKFVHQYVFVNSSFWQTTEGVCFESVVPWGMQGGMACHGAAADTEGKLPLRMIMALHPAAFLAEVKVRLDVRNTIESPRKEGCFFPFLY